jgi:polynucleotide 5'-hydroxyl-kinase GRC3/NOL9
MVSLHLLSSPLLSPPHLHLRKPELSFFLGDLTTKNIPQALETAVHKLFLAYCRCRDAYAESGDVASASAALLEAREHDSSATAVGVGGMGGGYAALEENPYWRHPLPLVINTDGWVRGMGADLLGSVIAIANPSYVLHLTSEKNSRSIPAILQLHEEGEDGTGGTGMDASAKKTAVFDLTPGRHVASRLAAQDLRDLR